MLRQLGLTFVVLLLVGCAETSLVPNGGACFRSTQCEPGLVCGGGSCTNDLSLIEGGVATTMDASMVDAAPVDAGPGVDAGPPMDSGPPRPDAGFDAGPPGMDAGFDGGPPGMDAGFDAGVDASGDAGPDA